MALADLSDLKAHLDYPAGGSSDDDELQLMLDAASEVVRGLVGDLDGGTVTQYAQVYGGTVLLDRVPTGPVSINGATGFTTSPAARLVTGVAAQGPVTVTYPVGGAAVPAAVKLATLIIAAHLWETQRGNGPGSLDLQGDSTPIGPVGLGYAVPSRAKELLASYVGSGQVA